MIYTSRYVNRELQNGLYTAVRISIGTPRWNLGYELAGAIKDLMPWGLKDIQNIDVFRSRYYERLNRCGVSRIRNQLQYFEQFGKDVVLLCYEDVRKGPHNWCHRTVFADWWLQEIGEKISELKDGSKFTPEPGYELRGGKLVKEREPKRIQELSLFEF